MLTRTFYGVEDKTLEAKLQSELPGILNWAIDGLKALDKRDAFTRPSATEEAYTALQDLASPVRPLCGTAATRSGQDGGDQRTCIDAYKVWVEEQGHPKLASTTFGRDLSRRLPNGPPFPAQSRRQRQRTANPHVVGIAPKP